MRLVLLPIILVLSFSISSTSVSADTGNEDIASEVSSAQIAATNHAAEDENYCINTDHSFDVRGECRTNQDAYVNINKAIQRWGISQRGEIVATIAWMLYESDGWKYNFKQTPVLDPRVATRAMLNNTMIMDYAWHVETESYINLLVALVSRKMTLSTGLEDIVRLVIEDEWSFGAGFWYLANKAPEYHNQIDKLRSGNISDFADYMEKGVGIDMKDNISKRMEWWQIADKYILRK